VAFVYGDRNPGQFLLVDVAARKAEPLLETRPWVKPEEAAEVAAFHIKARDGQPIHGYVTYPPGQAPGTKAPLVVVAHGGPHGVRDLWHYNAEIQLLASRGYAVLSVNYRGSGGYGRAYERVGYRHWGDLMMDDILDATRWLVGKGRVDGDRMCTFGGSFGGYSALQLVARAPDTFRCAIGFAGVYDLRMMEGNDEWADSTFLRSLMRTYLSSDQALLEAFSPALHADRITVPVFLIHGKKDVRVPIAHAEALRKALTERGRPPEWLVEPNEGHGFYDEQARERMYRAVLAFLDKHTAPPAPAAAAPAPATPPK
jgi:dipeptidyl aminopeptidase/acylaminoacyl peptidase